MLPDMQVPARYYIRMAEMLAAEGLPWEQLQAGLGLSDRALQEADTTIPLAKADQLLQHLGDNGMRGDIPFDLGKNITASAHGFVGFGMLNSATVDESLRFEARYFHLVLPNFVMQYRCGSKSAEMRFSPRVAMSRFCLNFHIETIGLAALRELQDLTGGERPPCRLSYSFAEPAHALRYKRELRDVDVQFGVLSSPGICLEVFDDLRQRKLQLADRHARRTAEERCRALVQREVNKGNVAAWVAMTLREVPDELPTLEELAMSLSLSKRSLNRYLEKEGTSFRELSGRIRHEIACERLSVGNMSPTEVAFSLGYSDPSNFSKAFRARQGCSPSQFRVERLS